MSQEENNNPIEEANPFGNLEEEAKKPELNQEEEDLDPNRPELIPDKSKMEYRHLGNSGLRVSLLSYGNWANNDNYKVTLESVKFCVENGINFFDTAEVYGIGKGEINLGRAIKVLNIPRDKIIVSSKIYKSGTDPNDTFLSRKHIIEGVKNSLNRLGLDYIDILYCHRYDMRTPLEETIKAIDTLVNNGTVLYWGTSNWTPSQIMEAIKICEQYKYVKPICEQSNYSMIKRDQMEKLRNLFKKYGYGITAFSPLYSGVLSGKYIKDIPIDSRYIKNKDATAVLKIYFDNKNKYDEKLNKLSEICKQLNCTLAQLAIAWVIVDPDVSTCILGATKLVQLEENIKALKIYKQLNKNILLEIEKILDNTPKGEMEWKEFKELPARRNINLNVDYIKGVTDVDTKKKKKPKKEEGEEGEGEEQQEEQQ